MSVVTLVKSPAGTGMTGDLAGRARRNLAAISHDAEECRDLGIMLGLFRRRGDGSVEEADPWATDTTTDPSQHPLAWNSPST